MTEENIEKVEKDFIDSMSPSVSLEKLYQDVKKAAIAEVGVIALDSFRNAVSYATRELDRVKGNLEKFLDRFEENPELALKEAGYDTSLAGMKNKEYNKSYYAGVDVGCGNTTSLKAYKH